MSLLFAFAIATAASAPSFNCMRASSKVERMICRDSELSAVDRAMAKLYSGVSSSGRKKLFTGQADWLKERDRCDDRECLLSTYD